EFALWQNMSTGFEVPGGDPWEKYFTGSATTGPKGYSDYRIPAPEVVD
ncbi:unnamed protein product, partial [marine sediment metagenome]